MNKKKNRGFSLVELIVVVAIMAVLVGVLAPNLLRYVEKTRVQKDATAVSEVVEAIKIAMADETINKNTTSGTEFSISAAGVLSCTTATDLEAEVKRIVGDAITYSSANAAAVTIKVTKAADTGVVTVEITAPTGGSGATEWAKAVANVK